MTTPQSRTILPGGTIGILGGGQLGRMLALKAKQMGYRVVTLDPSPDSPCGQVADEQIEAPYGDKEALSRLAALCDVITYEFENIDAEAVETLENMGKRVCPDSRVLRITQNRLLEKEFIRKTGVAVTEYRRVDSIEDMHQAGAEVGFPAVVKTAGGGYDGKGQYVLRHADMAAQAYQSLSGITLIWEKMVPFTKELSVICARNAMGEIAVYPVAENTHIDNILDTTLAPASVTPEVRQRAEEIARALAEGLDIVGTFCVELFLRSDNSLLVNEIAPRPHNSGHYTIEACPCSQFEQQVRAICGLPLGSTEIKGAAVMVNILGDGSGSKLMGVDRVLADKHAAFHLYGKSEAAAKRKMGHLTLVADSSEEALRLAESARKHLRWK